MNTKVTPHGPIQVIPNQAPGAPTAPPQPGDGVVVVDPARQASDEPIVAQPVAKLPVCPNCGERTFPLSDPIIQGLSYVLAGQMNLAELGANNVSALVHCGLLDGSYQPTDQAKKVVEHWLAMVAREEAATNGQAPVTNGQAPAG